MQILSYSLVPLISKVIKTANNELNFKANLSTINIKNALTNPWFVLASSKSTRHFFGLKD